VVAEKKLTATIDNEQNRVPEFFVLKDSLPAKVKKIKAELKATLKPIHKANNVLGVLPGKERDSFIVVCAHYDHLGRMGKEVLFAGANDNASGTAMLLSVADNLKKSGKPLKYSVMFIAFCGEEAGLLGSDKFVKDFAAETRKMKLVLNLDLMGGAEEGICMVNGQIKPHLFKLMKDLNDKHNWVKDVKARGTSSNSDHYSFQKMGVEAVFIYTLGSVTAYHDVQDTYANLPLDNFERLSALFSNYVYELAK
jgi:Zn-dependent M28 family amino/carboxypeptidase